METNKNMTAVEWIEVELKNWLEDAVCLPNYIFEEAKQMEKEQIMDAFDKGYSYYLFNGGGEQYYNKTYGK